MGECQASGPPAGVTLRRHAWPCMRRHRLLSHQALQRHADTADSPEIWCTERP